MAGAGPLSDFPFPGLSPEIFMLPLAVPASLTFAGLEAGVISRRIPDFLHQMLNQGGYGPTGLLEIQSPPEDGPVQWVILGVPPTPDEAYALVPPGEEARAVVAGKAEVQGRCLVVELHVHMTELEDEDESGEVTATVTLRTRITLEDPVRDLRRLAEKLAKVLELPTPAPGKGLLTANGPAFFKFLEGLDGVALLSGDLSIEPHADRAGLMRPFAQALDLDPNFGLALRTAHFAISLALEDQRIAAPECLAIIDDCLRAQPGDGDGCVAVAEQLVEMGDSIRALQWLEHATHLDPPPARGLESLGIHFANRGDTAQASRLWQQGLEIDGHPDFLGHLARLEFADGNTREAWRQVVRGLRRMFERQTRADEWPEDRQGCGILLRYVVDEIEHHDAPPEVAEALSDLCGLLVEDEDRIDLGLCLMAVGCPDLARNELRAGLEGAPELSDRDAALRALLSLDVPDFERRFAKAVDQVVGRKNPKQALCELQRFLALQPAFWPAQFFVGVAKRRMGDTDAALDAMAEVLRLRPKQTDALVEMANLFDARGNSKRAVECIDQALEARDLDPKLHALRSLFLQNLGRVQDATKAAAEAVRLAPKDKELKKRLRQLMKGE